MNGEGEGRRILEQCARLVGLPSGTGFVRADGSEYAAYRRFYLTAPPALR
jgi:phosphonate transport system substrate-binding protein